MVSVGRGAGGDRNVTGQCRVHTSLALTCSETRFGRVFQVCHSEHPFPGTLTSRPGLEKGHRFPGTPVRWVWEALTEVESPRPGQPRPAVHLRTLRVAVGAGCGNSQAYLTRGTLLGRHLKGATVATPPVVPLPSLCL